MNAAVEGVHTVPQVVDTDGRQRFLLEWELPAARAALEQEGAASDLNVIWDEPTAMTWSRVGICVAAVLLTTAYSTHAVARPCECEGDCDADTRVTVPELIRAVRIAVGIEGNEACLAADADGDGTVKVTDLIRGIQRSLDGCRGYGALACKCEGDTDCSTGVCESNLCCDVRCPAGRCDIPGHEGDCTSLLPLGSRCLAGIECWSEICDEFDGVCCNNECTLIGATCLPSGHCRIR